MVDHRETLTRSALHPTFSSLGQTVPSLFITEANPVTGFEARPALELRVVCWSLSTFTLGSVPKVSKET